MKNACNTPTHLTSFSVLMTFTHFIKYDVVTFPPSFLQVEKKAVIPEVPAKEKKVMRVGLLTISDRVSEFMSRYLIVYEKEKGVGE